MPVTDLAFLRAANLRLCQEEKDICGMVMQVTYICSVQEVRDILIALLIIRDTPVDLLRKALTPEISWET